MIPEEYNANAITGGTLRLDHITALVKAWQAAHGLEVDGKAGPLTLASITLASITQPISGQWLSWPMPVLDDGRKAVITSGFRPKDRPNHDGLDFFYKWMPGDQPSFVGDGGAEGRYQDGRPKWVVPFKTKALAAAGGLVTIAGHSATGFRVWIDHGNGWRTGYFHLLSLDVTVGQVVEVGDPVGSVGHNPSDTDGRHLHFELSPVGRYEPNDPTPFLRKP